MVDYIPWGVLYARLAAAQTLHGQSKLDDDTVRAAAGGRRTRRGQHEDQDVRDRHHHRRGRSRRRAGGHVARFVRGSASASGYEGQLIAPGDFAVADYAGKPLVVNLFGSWCPPCNAEAPDLGTFAKENPGAQVVGIACEDTQEAAEGFMTQYGLTYPMVLDDGSLVSEFGITAYPTTRSSSTPPARRSTASSARPPWTSSTPRWPRRSDALHDLLTARPRRPR